MERNDFIKAANKRELAGAYLLYGEEEFLRQNAVNSALNIVDPAMRALNVDILETAQADAVIAAAETLPFMAEKRVVLCKELPAEDEAERLSKYVEKVPDSTLLLFSVKGKVDGRTVFPKAMAKLGRSVNFTSLTPQEAKRYIQKRAKSLDAPITEQTAAFFVSVAGCDCASLTNELDKAASYAGVGNEITREVINKVVTKDIDYIVFTVLDHFIANRPTDGMRTLEALKESGEDSMGISILLRDKAKLVIQARKLNELRLTDKEKMERMGISSGYTWVVCDMAKKLSKAQFGALMNAAEALTEVVTKQLTGAARADDALVQALMMLAHK